VIIGIVLDVTRKAKAYSLGKQYSIFTASKGLAISSLKPENAMADCSNLNEERLKVLDDWYEFFTGYS
jgi:hypothetical protein